MSTNQSDQTAVKEQQEENQKQAKKPAKEQTGTKAAERKKQAEKKDEQQRPKPRRRIFPIWQRIIVIAVLSAAALIVGLMIGYGAIGGEDTLDILKKATWQHIADIVNKE